MEIKAKDKRTRQFLAGQSPRDFRGNERQAQKMLRRILAASDVTDLERPPGNKWKKLKGDEANRWQVRINDQYRIRFEITAKNEAIVEIGEFHKG